MTADEDGSDTHFGIVYSYDRLYPTITVGAFRFDEDVVTFVSGLDRRTYTETTQRLLAQVTVPYRRYRWQTAAWGGVIRDEERELNGGDQSEDQHDQPCPLLPRSHCACTG